MNNVRPIDLRDPDSRTIEEAASIILTGGLIVYPTETLYGIGVDATNGNAIARVHALKQRDGKPILIIVRSFAMLQPLVRDISDTAMMLMERFWPGPLTLVFEASDQVPRQLMQGRTTIGMRIPASEVCLRLLNACQRPITSTSANISGKPASRTIDDITHSFPSGIDLLLNGGAIGSSSPSTVVSVTGKKPELIREGAIPFSSIQTILLHGSR